MLYVMLFAQHTFSLYRLCLWFFVLMHSRSCSDVNFRTAVVECRLSCGSGQSSWTQGCHPSGWGRGVHEDARRPQGDVLNLCVLYVCSKSQCETFHVLVCLYVVCHVFCRADIFVVSSLIVFVRRRGSRRCMQATRGCVEFVCAVCLLEISVRYFHV